MGKICNVNCSVYGCRSRKESDPEIHFHKYPGPDTGKVNIVNTFGIVEEVDRRQAWALKLKMRRPVGKGMVVCSKHFTKDDYLLKGGCKVNGRLKLTAVPSVNLPPSPTENASIATMSKTELETSTSLEAFSNNNTNDLERIDDDEVTVIKDLNTKVPLDMEDPIYNRDKYVPEYEQFPCKEVEELKCVDENSFHLSLDEYDQYNDDTKNSETKMFNCIKCDNVFTDVDSFEAHLQMHLISEEVGINNFESVIVVREENDNFKSDDISNDNDEVYYSYHPNVDTNSDEQLCNENEVESKESEAISEISEKSKEKDKFICEECDQTFNHKSTLARHKRNMHSDNSSVRCPLCDKELRQYTLKRHISQVHNGEKVKCPECDRIVQKYHLKTHMDRVHNSVRVKCPECDKEIQKYLLKKHIELVHKENGLQGYLKGFRPENEDDESNL